MSAQPSVVHVLWAGEIGGIERLVTDLARAQISAGGRVCVAFGRLGGPFVAEVEATGCSVFDLRLESGYDVRPGRLLHAGRGLAEWEVIHLHTFNVPLAVCVLLSRRPVVFTDHGSVPFGRSAGMAEALKHGLRGVFLRRWVRRTAANSHHTAARASRAHRMARSSIRVVHNGLDLTSIHANEHPSPEAGITAVFVGRLVAFKRVDRIIEAARQLPPEAPVRILIVGGGPMAADLRQRAKRVTLTDRIRFLGPRADVANILSTADVLLAPSVDEPFGLAAVEGCAAGLLPAVFADGGGLLEVVPPDALIVKDPGELASALAALPGSPALAHPARAKRAKWVAERFSIAHTERSYRELYRSALGAGAGRTKGDPP